MVDLWLMKWLAQYSAKKAIHGIHFWSRHRHIWWRFLHSLIFPHYFYFIDRNAANRIFTFLGIRTFFRHWFTLISELIKYLSIKIGTLLEKSMNFMGFRFGGARFGIIDNFHQVKKNKMVGAVYVQYENDFRFSTKNFNRIIQLRRPNNEFNEKLKE